MELIHFIVTTFVIVDDFCKTIPVRKLRQRGKLPKLTDSEVITMEIVGEFLGHNNDKAIYRYFQRHWKYLFPQLPDRSNFSRQCANLWHLKELLFKHLDRKHDQWLQIIDSMPVEVCTFVRARRSHLFKDSASYGKWFGQTFFGYRLHLKINHYGMIRQFILAPANEFDVTFVPTLLRNDADAWVLGDRGYRSYKLHDKLLAEQGIYLHTSRKKGDTRISPLPIETIRWCTGARRLIETVGGQLAGRFAIKTTFARDLWHLMNRIIRKILAHTYCVFLNLHLKREPLNFDSLVY
jgi:hypothetical protein